MLTNINKNNEVSPMFAASYLKLLNFIKISKNKLFNFAG